MELPAFIAEMSDHELKCSLFKLNLNMVGPRRERVARLQFAARNLSRVQENQVVGAKQLSWCVQLMWFQPIILLEFNSTKTNP